MPVHFLQAGNEKSQHLSKQCNPQNSSSTIISSAEFGSLKIQPRLPKSRLALVSNDFNVMNNKSPQIYNAHETAGSISSNHLKIATTNAATEELMQIRQFFSLGQDHIQSFTNAKISTSIIIFITRTTKNHN